MQLKRPKRPTPADQARWRGISRIDQPSTRTHGWFVRVNFRTGRDGVTRPGQSKYFGDATYGGRAKSLLAARRWRDAAGGAARGRRAATKRRAKKKR